MRILLSSLCLFLAFGCASYPKKQGYKSVENTTKTISNPYFSDSLKDYVYKAKIDAFSKSFGGLFIVKKLGKDHHRIVFTTEMGNTLFDFSFEGDSFTVNRILKQLDKKMLIAVLKKDLRALIKENSPILKTFINEDETLLATEILSKKHYFCFEGDRLIKIVRIKNGKESVTFKFSETTETQAKHIRIAHKNINLKMDFTAIN